MSNVQVYMLPTLDAEWAEYSSRMCIGKTDEQVAEMKKTFFGGLYVMYMKLFGDNEEIPEEALMSAAESWRDELDAFMAQVQKDMGVHMSGGIH